MLKKYFDSKDDVAETLLKADQSLTEAAKKIEGENCWRNFGAWKLLPHLAVVVHMRCGVPLCMLRMYSVTFGQ